jgi:hypothetical protein
MSLNPLLTVKNRMRQVAEFNLKSYFSLHAVHIKLVRVHYGRFHITINATVL